MRNNLIFIILFIVLFFTISLEDVNYVYELNKRYNKTKYTKIEICKELGIDTFKFNQYLKGLEIPSKNIKNKLNKIL